MRNGTLHRWTRDHRLTETYPVHIERGACNVVNDLSVFLLHRFKEETEFHYELVQRDLNHIQGNAALMYSRINDEL